MKKPRISVLIPFYNRAAYISQVVQCALSQTYPPDEVIVVDDASTEDCQAVLDRLPARVIRHAKNSGPAIARNTAFAASSGDIVIFIDSDAYADSRMIEFLMNVYEKDGDPRLGGVGGQGIESKEESIYDRWRKLHGAQNFGPHYRREVDYLYGLCCSFKRESFEKVGGFDPSYPINSGEDLDIGYRLRKAGYYLSYDPQIVVYHQHKDTHESLIRVQYNWVYWNYITRKRHGRSLKRIYLGVYKRLLFEVSGDLFLRRNPGLVQLDIEIFKHKLNALKKVRQAVRQVERTEP